MSNNQASQNSAILAPACEKDELIIEVMGKKHPQGHAFRIYDPTDTVVQGQMESQVALEDMGRSMLHVWPAKKSEKKNVWLEMAAEQGPPIQVPLLQNVGVVAREIERQRYVVLPVVPTTPLCGVTLKGNNPVYNVMSRPGFLYLFYEGQLWREIEIRNDQKQTTFHDVPLTQYRSGDGFTTGSRPATGIGLTEIWLPARIDTRWQSLEVAYSESQLPAPRLNYLGERSEKRMERVNTIKMEMKTPDADNAQGETRLLRPSYSHAFAASVVPPQKARKPAMEWAFDRPDNYLTDLPGEFPSSAWSRATGIHQRLESQQPGEEIYEDERPDMTALSLCLHKTLTESSETEPSESPFPDAIWTANAEASPDVFADARNRKIGLIAVDDGLYRLRYLLQRRQVATWFCDAAVRRAQARPHFNAAFLLNSVVVPDNIGGKPNPLHQFVSDMSGAGHVERQRSMAEGERKLARQYLDSIQIDLMNALSLSSTQTAVLDLFTFDGFDYAGAFLFMIDVLQNLAREPQSCDALALAGDTPETSEPGKAWVNGLYEGAHSLALYSALFGQRPDANTLATPYSPPAGPEHNAGDGRFRSTELATLEDADLPEADDLSAVHGWELVEAADDGAFSSLFTAPLKAGSSVLISLFGDLWSALKSAQTALADDPQVKQHEHKIETLQAQWQQAEVEKERRQRHKADAQSRNRAARDQAAIAEAEQNLRTRELNEARIAAIHQRQRVHQQAILTRMGRYAPVIQGLRASMPRQMSELTLARLSPAQQHEYFIFAHLEASPDATHPARLFGELIDQSGHASPADAPTRGQPPTPPGGQADTAEKALLLVLPKNARVARSIDELVTAETAVIQAEKALAEASQLSRRQADDSTSLLLREIKAKQNLKTAEQSMNDLVRRIEAEQQSGGALKAAQARETVSDTTNSRLYRTLNTPVLPVFVMLVEGFNLHSVSAASGTMGRVRSKGRSRAGVISAGYDTALAAAVLAERFMGNVSVVALASKGLDYEVARTGSKLAEIFGGPVVVRGLLGAAAGFIVGFISISDALHAARMGNTGLAVGHGLLAASGFVLGLGGMVGASGLLFLGPAGWMVVGIALAIAGAGVVYGFTDNPMTTWMRNGPFGELNEKPFLKDPQEAYYRLVSLLMGVTITIEPNTNRVPRLDRKGQGTDNRRDAQMAAMHCLRIESPIPGLFDVTDLLAFDAQLRLVEKRDAHLEASAASAGRNKVELPLGHRLIEGDELNQYVLYHEKTDDGRRFYLDTPAPHTAKEKTWLGLSSREVTKTYEWRVRLQIRVEGHDRLLVFPAPPPEDPLTYDASSEEHTQPNFADPDQPFWFHNTVSHHG